MSALWPWALEAYARPGVTDACLRLQDERGQNVPLLLWALWCEETGRSPDLDAGARLARAWETSAVGPLRRLRRDLKSLPDLPAPDREAVRDRIKAAELEAERRLLLGLEVLTFPVSRQPEAVDARGRTRHLEDAAHAWGAPLAAAAFHDLLRRLNPRPA